MLDWIVEGLRWILWGLTSACLELMDICYKLIQQIALADFLNDPMVWQWYYTFLLFLGVLIVSRSLSIFMKFSFDEEFREKVNGSHFINKLVSIALVIGLLPVCLGFVSQVSAWGINNISMLLGTQASSTPSTLILTAFMNTDNEEYKEDGTLVKGDKLTYTITDIDINAEGEGDDDFRFFNEISDVFILAMIGIAASIMLIINGLQIGKRMFSLVMKFLIAPIPISSMIVPGDETFSMWRKMIVSDYLLNFVQTLMIIVVVILSGSTIIQNLSVWVQIISFLSGLLLLLSGVPELAKIIGGDTSQGSVLQQVASFRMATRGMGHGAASLIGGVARGIGGGAKTAGALGAFGIGRALGGESISKMQENMKAQGKNSDNGFMGGNKFDGTKSKNNFGSSKGNGSFGSSNNKNTKAFHEESTGAQCAAGEKYHISGIENMSKGDASLALEKAGADKSYWSDYNQNNQNQNNHSFANESINNSSASGFSESAGSNGASSSGFKDSVGSNGNDYSNNTSGTASNSNQNIYSKPGSAADKFSQSAQSKGGFKGASAKLATNVSRHLYQSSAQRISQTKTYRAGSYAKQVKRDLTGGK